LGAGLKPFLKTAAAHPADKAVLKMPACALLASVTVYILWCNGYIKLPRPGCRCLLPQGIIVVSCGNKCITGAAFNTAACYFLLHTVSSFELIKTFHVHNG
jgi:hypothetical protein